MKATAEKVEKNTVVLEVEVEPEKFSEAMNQAYRKIVKKVSIPGFRKGKAPRIILERYLGKQALYDEAVEIIIPDAYISAVEDTGIEPVAQPELEVIQLEEGKPVVFKAKVVVKPEVNLGQYTDLEIVNPGSEVADEEIQQEVERLRNRHAKLINLEEGTVEVGDLAAIDFEGKTDGIPFEGGTAGDYSLEIGSGSFIPGFEDQIVGMNINETRDINVTFPQDYGKEDLAGKEAVFTVTVKSIRRKELASLDDEFAKDVSEFDTLEELRADLANKLKQAAEEKAKAQIHRDVVSRVVENAQVEVPREMIDSRMEEMIRNMNQRLSGQGISLEKYLTYTNSNMDDLKERVRPDAEQSVLQSLVIDAVAKAENLTVGDEEISEEINRMGVEMKQDPEVVRKILEGQNQLEFIKESLLRDKAVQYLVYRAVLVEGTNQPEKE
ncbi:MAG: trigger factor [Peptococcaceae bacterium BRH_c4a]|nr:MAG: trigger factor [Peptococcaceae bacterium BRH_c4a]